MAELKKRRLGRTGLMVTELGLGAMDTPQSKEGAATLNAALDMGINFIDTARIYQDSEFLIGQVIRQRNDRSFHIATKTINRTRDGAQYDVDKSLRLLGVDKIDLYQVDDVSTDEDWDAAMREGGPLEGLKIARYRGLIGYIGITSHSLEVLEKAILCGEFETVMIEYSAFSHETERLIELAMEKDVGVIAMRPLGGSGRASVIRTLLSQSSPKTTLTPARLLTYVLSNPNISVAIAGARYPSRITDNVTTATTYRPMNEERTRQLEAEAIKLFEG